MAKYSLSKIIVEEKRLKDCFGRTYCNGPEGCYLVQYHPDQPLGEWINTMYHELTHVLMDQVPSKLKKEGKDREYEEAIARVVADVAGAVVAQYFSETRLCSTPKIKNGVLQYPKDWKPYP